MLTANHPDDERLSAWASDDADARGDAALTEHLASCARCAPLADELRSLRMSLAALPDIAPPRALRLLPEVEAAATDRLGAWVRRAFGPVMAAGAAIALVGMVGTVGPSLPGSAALPAGEAGAPPAAESEVAAERLSAAPAVGGVDSPYSDPQTDDGTRGVVEEGDGDEAGGQTDSLSEDLSADRSPWPMVLFTGVALLIGAALLRWILVPRAG